MPIGKYQPCVMYVVVLLITSSLLPGFTICQNHKMIEALRVNPVRGLAHVSPAKSEVSLIILVQAVPSRLPRQHTQIDVDVLHNNASAFIHRGTP